MKRPARKLVLASASPRRRDLLRDAGFEFEIVRARAAESENRALSMRELTTLNATRKALEVAPDKQHAVVLAADTLVSIDDAVIGKPTDFADAIRILQMLRGRTHQVCTGVFVCAAAENRRTSFHVISHVTFRAFNDDQIAAYLSKIEPLDKAGAYAAQDKGKEIIAAIDGSFSNVVGLPMDETIRVLRSFGVVPKGASA